MKTSLIKYGLIAAVMTATLPFATASTFIVTNDELEPDVFPDVAESIIANLDGPNAPRGLSSASKRQIERSLDRIQDYLLDDPESNRSKIESEQVRVNALLAPTVAKDTGKSEVVCRRVKKIGSNIPTTECRTRAEMEREEQAAHNAIQSLRDAARSTD